MNFIDTHVHLHFPEYENDRAEVIENARRAGVGTFINVGTDAASSRASLELAKAHDFIYAAAGIHPHDAKDADEKAVKEMEELFKNPKMAAIGEVGLDFFRDHSPRQKQEEIFRGFLDLHRITSKPLVIHCRDAYERMLEMLREELKPPVLGVMHCFSSDKITMKRFLDLGLFISFAGPLTYKKNDALREACKACPLDRLLLETDAPFLPPQTRRGQRNEPAWLLETAQTAAGLHGIPVEELGEKTSANAGAVFKCC